MDVFIFPFRDAALDLFYSFVGPLSERRNSFTRSRSGECHSSRQLSPVNEIGAQWGVSVGVNRENHPEPMESSRLELQSRPESQSKSESRSRAVSQSRSCSRPRRQSPVAVEQHASCSSIIGMESRGEVLPRDNIQRHKKYRYEPRLLEREEFSEIPEVIAEKVVSF